MSLHDQGPTLTQERGPHGPQKQALDNFGREFLSPGSGGHVSLVLGVKKLEEDQPGPAGKAKWTAKYIHLSETRFLFPLKQCKANIYGLSVFFFFN